MIHSDTYFAKGSTHRICQDYACHGVNANGVHFAMVSDGCSSSPDTDVGSRLLCIAMKKLVSLFTPTKESFQWFRPDNVMLHFAVGPQIPNIMRLLNNEFRCLDATLLVAVAAEFDGKVNYVAMRFGDGTISKFHTFKDGRPIGTVSHTSFTDQTPEYIGNMLWLNGPQKDTLKVMNVTYHKNRDTITLPQPLKSNKIVTCKVGTLKDGEAIVLTSDGIDSFSNQHTPLEFEDVLREAIPFKAVNGEFITRRMQMMMKKNPGYSHYDDFSIAGISYTV